MKLPAWGCDRDGDRHRCGKRAGACGEGFQNRSDVIRALDTIVSPGREAGDVLGERFGLTKGLVWVQESNWGYLLFSDSTRRTSSTKCKNETADGFRYFLLKTAASDGSRSSLKVGAADSQRAALSVNPL